MPPDAFANRFNVVPGHDGPLLVGLAVNGLPWEILKLALEMSKKMLPTASIFILALVAGVLGMVTTSEPSLGVAVARMKGNVNPPSVDKVILTAEQLTGAAVVLLTLQVIVCEEPPT